MLRISARGGFSLRVAERLAQGRLWSWQEGAEQLGTTEEDS